MFKPKSYNVQAEFVDWWFKGENFNDLESNLGFSKNPKKAGGWVKGSLLILVRMGLFPEQ